MSSINECKKEDSIFQYSDIYNDFSIKTKELIEAMCYMATIKSENLNKDEITQRINTIQCYISNCQSANNSVNNMFGFKEKFEEIDFGTKEYYFFIADIKIKSTVYLLRINNFLNNWEASNSIKEKRERFLSDVENMKIADVKTFFETIKTTNFDKNLFSDIRKECEKLPNEDFCIKLWREDEKAEDKDKKIELREIDKNFQSFCKSVINFLKEQSDENLQAIAEIYKTQKEKITKEEEIQDKLDVQDQLNGIISFDNVVELFSEHQNIQVDKSIEYYLFDNSMKEIDFCGSEWDWIWRYEQGKEDLFRCVGTDKFTYDGDYTGKDRRLYYQNMIKNIVSHMNKGGSTKLASYSKNPFRDIYKYMISENQVENTNSINYSFNITEENSDADESKKCYKAELIEEDNQAVQFKNIIFAMVKQANTNIIKKMYFESQENDSGFSIRNNFYSCKKDDTITFSTFVLDEEKTKNAYCFCLDIFKTKEYYSGDVRKVFGRYTSKFPDTDIPNHQLSIVASSDEEVVMLGNTCDEIVKHKLPKEYDECEENVEYRVELNKDEILCLFYRMHMLCNDDKLKINSELELDINGYSCSGIPVKLAEENTLKVLFDLKNILKDNYLNNKIENISQLIDNKELSILTEVASIINNSENDNKDKIKSIKDAVSNFEENIKEAIKDCIVNRVKEYQSRHIDFVLSFLEKSEYKKYSNYGKNTYHQDKDDLVALYRKVFLK